MRRRGEQSPRGLSPACPAQQSIPKWLFFIIPLLTGATKPSVQGAVAGTVRRDEVMAGEDNGEVEERSRMGGEEAAL